MKKIGAILLLLLLPYLVYAVTESIFLKPDWSQFLYVDTCTVVWRLDSDTTEIWVYDTTDYLGNYPIPDSVETGLYRIYVDGTYYQDKNHIRQSDTTVYAGYFDGLVGGTQDSAVYADTAGKPDSTQIAGWGFGSGALGDSVGWPELMTAVTDSIQDRTDSTDVAGWGFGTTTDSSDVAGFGFVAGAHIDSSDVAGWGYINNWTAIKDSANAQKVDSSAFSDSTGALPDIGLFDQVGIGIVSAVTPLHIYENTSLIDTTAGMTIEQNGTGDAVLQFKLSDGQRYVMGIDNDVSDRFVISSSADLSANPSITIHQNGEIHLSHELNMYDHIASYISGGYGYFMNTVGSDDPVHKYIIEFLKCRNTTASPSVVQSGDHIGCVNNQAWDGSGWKKCSDLLWLVEGTVKTDTVPTTLHFIQMTDVGLDTILTLRSNGYMGINNPAPTELLHIIDGVIKSERDDASTIFQGNVYATDDWKDARVELRRSGGTKASPATVANSDAIGRFQFGAYDGNSWVTVGEFGTTVDGTVGNDTVPAQMWFSVMDDTGGVNTAMTIKPSGKIGIGTITPSEVLEVDGEVVADTFHGYLRGWADSAGYATAAGGVADTAAWADSAGYADSAGVADKALDLEAASSVVEDSEVDNDITIAGASNVIGLVASLGAKEDTGHVHSGSDITSGTVPDSVCPDTLHRDYETKDGDYVSFDDPDNNFTATSVDEAISELFDNIGGANHDPNQATSKIDWSELNAVPAGFADGVDNTGSAEWVDDGDYIYPTENDSARIVTGTDTAWITGLGIDLWTGSGGKSDTGHTHDGRYYTETEVDGFVGAKTDTLDFAKVADDTTHFKEAYGWGDHSTQGYIDSASLNSEAELEGILVGVTNVFTNNDGALNDDDVSLTDVQTATTSDFHNIGGTDANSIDSIFFQLTNGTWGTQGWYGLNDTFDVDTSDATGGASGDSSWVRCSVTVAYVDTFRPRSATDSMWFFGTCIFEAGSTKVGSIWVYNKFSGVSRLIPDSTLNFFGYPNTVKDSSMARWVNVFDEFASSDQTNLQDVLDDFDAAIVGAGYAGLGWGIETFGSPESLRADMTTLDDTFYTQAQVHDTLDAKRDTSYEVPDAYVADNISIDASGSVHHDALDAQGAVLDENMTITGNWVNTAYPWAENELVTGMATEAEASGLISDSLTSIRFMERIYATSFFYDPSPGDSINIYLPKYNTSDYMGWAEMECTTGIGQQLYNYETYFTLPCGFDSFDNDSAFLFYYKTEDADVDTTAIKFVVYEAGTAKDSTAWVAYAADTAVALANTSMSGLAAEDKARIIIRCRALKRAAAAMSVFAGDIEVRGWRSLH